MAAHTHTTTPVNELGRRERERGSSLHLRAGKTADPRPLTTAELLQKWQVLTRLEAGELSGAVADDDRHDTMMKALNGERASILAQVVKQGFGSAAEIAVGLQALTESFERGRRSDGGDVKLLQAIQEAVHRLIPDEIASAAPDAKAPATKFKLDRIELESAIIAVAGMTQLTVLAIEDAVCIKNKAFGVPEEDGFKILMLNQEQFDCCHTAINRLVTDVNELEEAFYGPNRGR